MLKCDVFIVGCGPAGASLAYYLTQKNIKVIAAEKKKSLDKPVRCAEFVPANIAGLFDFKISGLNNQTGYLETYIAKNTSEKFHLVSKTSAPGFILDRDTFINDIATRFTKAGGRLFKGTKVISIQRSDDGFILDLFDTSSKNHLKAKAKIIAGADGPLSLIGRHIFSVNKSFMPAIQLNPPIALKNADSNKVFFSPYIPCGYGWLFPKTDRINLGIGAILKHKNIHSSGPVSGLIEAGNSSPGNLYGGDPSKDEDTVNSDIKLKKILALFTRHLEFSGIFEGSISEHQPIIDNDCHIGKNGSKGNIFQLLPIENKNGIEQDKSSGTYKQFSAAVTGLIPDSGIVDNPGSKDGFILCGDAAGLCNPVTGAGIYNSIRSAKLASETIIKSLIINDLNILQEIKETYNSEFGNSINRALRKKLIQKNNWPLAVPDMADRNGFVYKDTVNFSDLIRQTWVSFRDYWR
jgi:flavin-dependent dehydrogenase